MNISPSKFAEYAKDPVKFREDLRVDVSGTVRRFGDVINDWQRADFAAIDPAMMRCNGQSDDNTGLMRAYLERSRGHSKTTDLAVMCVWILAFAKRAVKGYAFAADKDQANLLKDAIDVIVRLNPWLSTIIEVQRGQALNIAKGHPGNGARLEIFASDVASSYGILADFIIADELTHWTGDGSLWHSIISSAAKRSNSLLVIIANSGFVDSWQWPVRETARTEDSWYFSRLDGPVASWMTPDRLAEQRKMLPLIAYNRLWLNEWSSGGGDALTPEDIAAAFDDTLAPMTGRENGYYFVGGSDLGLTRDCAAFVVLAVPMGGIAGRIRLAHHKLWKPTLDCKINLLDVQQHILQCCDKYNLQFIGFDPWQHEALAQHIEADTDRKRRNSRRRFNSQPFMREIPPSAANLRLQTTLTIESFQDRRLSFYDCEPLRRDLTKLRVEEKSYGYRLVSPRDGDGHGDTFSAFALALIIAHELAGKRASSVGVVSDSTTNWLERFDRRQAAWQAEQDLLDKPATYREELLDAIYEGRVRVLGQ